MRTVDMDLHEAKLKWSCYRNETSWIVKFIHVKSVSCSNSSYQKARMLNGKNTSNANSDILTRRQCSDAHLLFNIWKALVVTSGAIGKALSNCWTSNDKSAKNSLRIVF